MALAQQALTVNAACGGRLCLGIGLSHQVVIEAMMGLSYDKPVRHLRDYLSVLMPLLHDGKVSYDGDAYRVQAVITVNGGTAPDVVVAALGPQLLALAGRLTDGTLTWCVGPDTLRDFTVPTITAAAEAAGRPAPRIIAASSVAVTADPAAARERAATTFAIYGQLPSYRAMLDREGVADGPTAPSSARSSRWSTASPRWPRWASPTSRPPRSAPPPTSARPREPCSASSSERRRGAQGARALKGAAGRLRSTP